VPCSGIEEILVGLGTPEPSQAWADFLDCSSTLIIRVIGTFERDPDRVSECFLFVCERLSAKRCRKLRRCRVDGPASFETWLRAIVRNLCLDWHRQEFGRFRVFQNIARLTPLQQAVFRCVYERGCAIETAQVCLGSRFPGVSAQLVQVSVQRIEGVLTPRQQSLLLARRAHWDGTTARGPTGEEDLLAELSDPRPNPESAAGQRERMAALQRALRHLPGEERLLIIFRFIREMTLEQVARIFHFKGTQDADRRIRKVLAQLRRKLE